MNVKDSHHLQLYSKILERDITFGSKTPGKITFQTVQTAEL